MAATERKSRVVADNKRRIVIMGAAGRDFHNFNVLYRDDPTVRVVAFTAAQIPGIAGRRYPADLAGPQYPDGIPILPEEELASLCQRESVDQVDFAYSDVTHETVMHAGSRALAAGADFNLPGPRATMLESRCPVIAVSALRTGCGKSQIGRWLSVRLRGRGLKVGVLRHPMPYGDLARQQVQRFATAADLTAADCTIEEREEYEPHIAAGGVIFAGVDYARILEAAEAEADVIVWEGGNNDFPFVRPDLHIVVADALRPDHVTSHHPGETVLRMADVVVINKAAMAPAADVERLTAAIAAVVSGVPVVRAASPVVLDAPDVVAGRRVLVVEDGPTITHGGMAYGAGLVAVRALPGVTIVDPHGHAAPLIRDVYAAYPHIGPVLPATGYGDEQRAALAQTIDDSDAEVVVAATPVDLATILDIDKPVVRARYEYADLGTPNLSGIVDGFLDARGL
jgi:predicted GTPase